MARKLNVYKLFRDAVDGTEMISFKETDLLHRLQNAFNHVEGYGSGGPLLVGIPLEQFLRVFPSIKEFIINHNHSALNQDGWCDLDTWAEEQLEKRRAVIRARLDMGVALFNDLSEVFAPGSHVTDLNGDTAVAGIVKKCRYRRSLFGEWLEVTVEVISHMGKLTMTEENLRIPSYRGTAKIEDLPVQMVTDAIRERLVERGKLFREFCAGPAYAQYSGVIERVRWFGSTPFRADGRVMIDAHAFQTIDPDGFRDLTRSYGDNNDEDIEIGEIRDEDLWRCAPYLSGFSFAAKRWGRMTVANLSPIKWRDDAFDKLVLDQETKVQIRALVEHHNGSFEDIVDGKSGGCIFLLAGPPGQGKTLSAESVAELLHKPLYMISVGELGTDPDQLETRLRMILDVATMWDAVLLLDEADIFLEARDEHNIVRNAMVGVFLRLLEYHSGVLFLTSNRAKNIDEAFFSRISVAIGFTEADASKRKAIWDNLAQAANIQNLNTEALAEHDLNGRQIKNALRLAQTLARSENVSVTMGHVERCINLTTQFQRDVMAERKKQQETVRLKIA